MKHFITCPAGLEQVLAVELKQFGAEQIRETVTGIVCELDTESMYRTCLQSRIANRVLLILSEESAGDREGIYQAAKSIEWLEHMEEGARIRVDFSGSNDEIRHTQFGARVIKDAVVDYFTERGLVRPDVDLDSPQHRINVRMSRKHLYISLDLSGESLHKRAYRSGTGAAPIKENLAAGLLARANWSEIAQNDGDFVDPMCGSGTFLIEAAWMALGIAPGLLRTQYGFTHWKQHDREIWERLFDEASEQKSKALTAPVVRILGCENDAKIATQAVKNVKAAGLSKCVQVFACDLEQADFEHRGPQGLVLSNPPYGIRIGDAALLGADYFKLAKMCKARFKGWQMGIVSSSPELLSETRLRADKKYKVFNGSIQCELRIYSIRAEGDEGILRSDDDNSALSEGAIMVANRLKKNRRRLKNWLKNNSVSCYRVYDADLPEYASAVDIYGDYAHIQEYEAPKTVDETAARRRLNETISAVRESFSLERDQIFVKTRKINRGTQQYEKYSEVEERDFFIVSEGTTKLRVNLKSYLDSGLFLDHRPLRLKIAQEAIGKSFLNLFCYTATASVHAALGGAKSSVSVDMSNTYIAWAQKNYELNNINTTRHQLIREDVFKWIKECRLGFDLIMLDPPSFSNSKKMDSIFDVQRDHVGLIRRSMELLNSGGVLYFSNNFKKFILDESLRERFTIEDISPQTVDVDFERNLKIHHCFKISHSV